MTYKPVDTAITMIVGPLIDDTDFKSLEEAIAYNATGMDVSLIIEKTDGTNTVTAITLTTGGTSDWTHKDGGYYEIEVTAAQNIEEGIGYIRGVCDGVLPFESIHYNIVKANIYDSWVKGTDILQSNITQLGGITQSATDLKDFVDVGYDPITNKIEGVKLTDTTTTNTDMVGTNGANTTTPPTVIQIRQEMDTNSTDLNSILEDTNELQTDWKNTGRLDNLLDAIPTTAMRGTDGANTTVPDVAGTLASYDPPTRTEATADKDTIIADLLTMKQKVAGTYNRETDSMEAIRDQGDSAWITGGGGSAPTVGEIRAEMEGVGYKLATIEADTNELQTDWVNGGRLDLLLDAIPITAMRGTDNAGLATDLDATFMLVQTNNTDINDLKGTDFVKDTHSMINIVTDTNELQLNQGNWLTATGFSTHNADAIWSVGTRSLTDKVGFALSTSGIKAIWDQLTSAITTIGSVGKLLVDNINTTITSRSPASEYDTEMARLDVAVSTRNATTPNTVIPDIAGTAATLHGITNSKIDVIDNIVDAIKLQTDNLPSGITKNEALPKFDFLMVLSSDHVSAATGKTITGEISKDGGAFTSITNTITEVSSGMYTIANGFTATEMNGETITLKFDAADCDTRIITIITT